MVTAYSVFQKASNYFVFTLIVSASILFQSCGQTENKTENNSKSEIVVDSFINETIKADSNTNVVADKIEETKEVIQDVEKVKPVNVVKTTVSKTIEKNTSTTPVEVKKEVEKVIEQKKEVVTNPDPVIKQTEVIVKKIEEVKPVETPVSNTTGSWPVPDKYKNMKNPFNANGESLALGKSTFAQMCKSCHGAKGLGDGPKAANLDTKIRSFHSAEFKAQKPGDIYYKSFVGRKEMPNFEKRIESEEERWAIVNYLLSL